MERREAHAAASTPGAWLSQDRRARATYRAGPASGPRCLRAPGISLLPPCSCRTSARPREARNNPGVTRRADGGHWRKEAICLGGHFKSYMAFPPVEFPSLHRRPVAKLSPLSKAGAQPRPVSPDRRGWGSPLADHTHQSLARQKLKPEI